MTESPWLLFEFMEHGDLASVLRNNTSHNVRAIAPSEWDGASTEKADEEKCLQLHLTHESLIDIAMQIAEGMKYLAMQHFVHRDLAARNCLVSATGVVKISDFGLSRDVYTSDYYKIGGSKLLPIRWMAPESILFGRFTLESDVWAYGTVLWEIYTWGKQPYYGHSNEEVVQLILDGVLLCPPSDSPPLIQEIMAGCWKTETKDRLNFCQIFDKFAKSIRSRSGYSLDHAKQEAETEGIHNIASDSFVTNMHESEYEIPRVATPTQVEYLQVL